MKTVTKVQNPIHIKLEYSEALCSKRDILSSQMYLLNATKSLKRYRAFRQEEMNIKEKLQKKMKAFSLNIKNTLQMLPEPKLPELLKKGREEVVKEKIKIKEPDTNDLEAQLAEIQEKLRAISA
jgi:hypothetical protein